MQVRFLPRSDPPHATGVVCAIDVISAFTSAAWILARGADHIIVAETAQHALALKAGDPSICLVGEARGLMIDGFDYPNDLTTFKSVDFTGRTCVIKTSSGTESLIANRSAPHLLAASLCNAKATSDHIRATGVNEVSFIITNNFKSAEDVACAAYICEWLFPHERLERAHYQALVRASRYGADVLGADTGEMAHLLDVDCFDFAMPCRTEGGLLRIEKVRPPAVETSIW